MGYRYLNGYGSHTFKMVNAKGEPNYVKFHYKTDQGIKCFDRHQADEMAKQARSRLADCRVAFREGHFTKDQNRKRRSPIATFHYTALKWKHLI